jgi:hypothetical protein
VWKTIFLLFPVGVVHVGLWHSSIEFIHGIWSQALPPWTVGRHLGYQMLLYVDVKV